ncbi:SDR family oxidoreductase [Streptomyces justiciae]|uniref:SDR family oxidoreductase n=1 Tax=Streptomyces justiciae TaxID=2780140 RepID=UPI0021187949|nr:SDR family oxidoreductase [Streptomyces justiciae]MCW8376240.1 SDR family oxidoreductase [Streptomyces justiciae]
MSTWNIDELDNIATADELQVAPRRSDTHDGRISAGGVEAAVQSAVAEYGRLGMAFNNAGIQLDPSDETAENFDRVNAVNLRGVWASMKHELRQMREQGSGAIVNCSSLGGIVGPPEHAAKHGVIDLTRSTAVEYSPRGIRINAVCPGVIETLMVADMVQNQAEAMAGITKEQPIGRLGTPPRRRLHRPLRQVPL